MDAISQLRNHTTTINSLLKSSNVVLSFVPQEHITLFDKLDFKYNKKYSIYARKTLLKRFFSDLNHYSYTGLLSKYIHALEDQYDIILEANDIVSIMDAARPYSYIEKYLNITIDSDGYNVWMIKTM